MQTPRCNFCGGRVRTYIGPNRLLPDRRSVDDILEGDTNEVSDF